MASSVVPIWDATQTWESLSHLLDDRKRHGEQLVGKVDFDKFLENPLEVTESLFLEQREMSPIVWGTNFLNALHMTVLERKCSGVATTKITSMNHPNFEAFKNGQVVSFRCMIQSRINTEFTPSTIVVENPLPQLQNHLRQSEHPPPQPDHSPSSPQY